MTAAARPQPRMPAAAPMATAAGVLFAAMAMWGMHGLASRGFSSGLTNDLMGDVLLGVAGKMPAGDIITSYPPLTFLPVAGLQWLTGMPGASMAGLLSALLAGGLAGLWLHGLLRAGYGAPAAIGLAGLLTCNPLFLRALAAGPEGMFTLWGVWLFASSLSSLRNSGGVNDLMLCSASLILLVFTGPLGTAYALFAIPFLMLGMPTDIRLRSHLSIYLMLLFPVLFSLLGFSFTNWMLRHDALAFLPENLAEPDWPVAEQWKTASAAILLAVAAVPIVLGQFILVRTRRLVQAPAFALLGALIVMGVAAVPGEATDSLALALIPAVPTAAVCAIRWPRHPHRSARVALLLMLGMAGAAFVLTADHSPANLRFRNAIQGHPPPPSPVSADRRLGMFLAKRSGVMIDATAYPAVIAARGYADGLVTPADTGFVLAQLRRRVDASEVAVKAPDPARTADAINRIMPELYASGAPGYRLVYDHEGWRVWSREPGEETKR